MSRHFPHRREREIESLIEVNASRPIRRWQFTGSMLPWAIGFFVVYVALVSLNEHVLAPVTGPAAFAPAAGLPVALGIVFGRRAVLPLAAGILFTALSVRFAHDEAWVDGLPVALSRLVTTFVALLLTVRVENRFWHRPAIRSAAFGGVAIIAAAAGAPFACWRLRGQAFWTDCAVWTGASATGIVLVASGIIGLLQLRPWHSADRWTRLAGLASLIGACCATGLAIGTGSLIYLFIAIPLIILASTTADVRLVLTTAIAIVGVLAWTQAEGFTGDLDLATSTLGMTAALLTLATVTNIITGITLEQRLVGNELAAIVDTLPDFGASIDRNYKARRVMIPRRLREQGLGLDPPEGVLLSTYVHPDDLPKTHAAIDKALAGEPGQLQVRVDSQVLGHRVFDVNVARINRGRALMIAKDVTETQELERERNWEAARYRAIAKSLGQGLAEVDFETELVIYANQNWADVLGASLDQLIGQRLNWPLRNTMDTSEIGRRLRKKHAEPIEFTFVHPDRSRRWILLRAVRTPRPDGGGSLLVLANDITKLRETERRRLKIENELTLVEQTERERFAKALHSSPIQMLTAVGLQLGAMQGADPDRSRELAELEAVVGESIVELREIIGSLIPPDGSAGRVVQSLEHYLDRIGIDRGRVTFSDLTVDPPTGQTGIAAVGIAREALMNALLHSSATQITVRLSETEEYCRIEVEDDGIGFELESTLGETGHLGLRSMFEYAAPVGGHCEVTSPVTGGTRVRADLPKHRPAWPRDRTQLDSPPIAVVPTSQ